MITKTNVQYKINSINKVIPKHTRIIKSDNLPFWVEKYYGFLLDNRDIIS